MNATIKYSKAIKAPRGVPAIPLRRTARRGELSAMEAIIHASGGKPMSRDTKRRLVQAGCAGFPKD